MKNTGYFFDLLEQSRVSLFGYTAKDERIKDEIISKIPHLEIGEIDSSFSFKSMMRNIKLEHVLDGREISIKSPTWIILDVNSIRLCRVNLGEKQKVIRHVVENIRESLFKDIPDYRLLIVTQTYRNLDTNNIVDSFIGGSTPVYMSDLVFILKDGNVKIMKNRFGDNDIDISLDDLKDYQYICNYETSNK